MIVLRWLRASQPSGLSKRGGLNTRNSAPASVSVVRSDADAVRAQPIADDANRDPRARFRRERLGELAPDRVVREDVAFEEDRAPRVANRREPRRIIFLRVEQQAHAVAADRFRAGRPRKRALGEFGIGRLAGRGRRSYVGGCDVPSSECVPTAMSPRTME